ncbi:MAG TPA: hypothetical protein VLH81_04090, partial [Desulfobacterales bacterium]|nr:hypothetical protein [Desulfobacterales bacterium]
MADGLPLSISSKAEERVSVAPNWKLVWWRFRKNRLAVASAVVLLLLYVVVLVPGFFATHDPEETEAARAFIPLTGVSLRMAGGLRLSVPSVTGLRDPILLKMVWKADPTVRIPIRFFARGYRYRILGVFWSDRHLVGPVDPEAAQWVHLLGTDRLGRDQWSRMMYGTRTSLTVSMAAVAMSVLLGVALGGISGYFGGWIDQVIQRLIELLQSLPTIPIWLVMTAALPKDWR